MAKKSTDEVVHTSMALYRKYRPQSFEDIRGDQGAVAVLEAAVKKGDIAHAYLFAGGRGTGKTSMARILARAVGTSEKDVYEMDAASNRGIDEIRELREGVSTLPFESKYKFYIIDEAHALTKDAWGALLKTLEEPPSHVVFVLATTELDRVPETIQSRCQVFRFKKPSHETLKKLILDVAKKEGALLEPTGAELIALMGEGSFRDTLSVLQKVLTISDDKKLSEDEIAAVVGAPSSELVNNFLHALAGRDIAKAIELFGRALEEGAEPQIFILLLVAKVRAILFLRFSPQMKASLTDQFSEADMISIEKLAGKEGSAINSQTLAELLTALIETPRSPMPQIPLELALYRMFETSKT
jgi:DNA polymerase-3 subunit gamma/tau